VEAELSEMNLTWDRRQAGVEEFRRHSKRQRA